MLYEALKASKGIYTNDTLAKMWGAKLRKGGAVETSITGNLPLTFDGLKAAVLKNYRLYGTSEGAGVETVNLYNYLDDTANCYLKSDGTLKTDETGYYTSDFIAVEPSTTYTITRTGSVRVKGYDSTKQPIRTDTYNDYSFLASTGNTFTVDSDAHYIRFTLTSAFYDNCMLVKGSTAPASYIPPGYRIPLTVTSGQNTDTYPLYIGSTKLGAEEYVDYESGKVYKEPPNIFDYTAKDANKGYIANTYIKTDGTTISSSSAWVSEYIEVTEGETYALTNFATTAAAYAMCRYDASKNFVSGSATKFLFRTVIPSGVKYIRITVPNPLETTASIKLDRQIPTDPPAPFPDITAYSGENVLSSTETVGSVTITGYIKEQGE